jgi:hypothetical protein
MKAQRTGTPTHTDIMMISDILIFLEMLPANPILYSNPSKTTKNALKKGSPNIQVL